MSNIVQPSPISNRASETQKGSLLYEAFLKCKQDPFDAENNPEGFINMGTAENSLVFDLIQAKLQEASDAGFELKDTMYIPSHGTQEFRESLCSLLERNIKNKEGVGLDADNIAAATGCGAIVHQLSFAICDRGDRMLMQCPYYGGFDMDVGFQGVEIVDVEVGSDAGFIATKEDFERVWKKEQEQEEGQGKGEIKAMLICQPNNPLGIVYTREQMEEYLGFAMEHGLHLISDEMYQNSVFDESVPFTSILDVAADMYPNGEWKPFVHVASGLAKDFALNGFKVGFAYSENQQVMGVLKTMTIFSSISSHTQLLIQRMLGDAEWRDEYIVENNKRIKRAYEKTVSRLGDMGLVTVKATAGFFVWIDGRELLHGTNTVEQEQLLFETLINDHKLYINPGWSFHSNHEPGWFRMVYSHDDNTLDCALDRMEAFVENILSE